MNECKFVILQARTSGYKFKKTTEYSIYFLRTTNMELNYAYIFNIIYFHDKTTRAALEKNNIPR